jgi:spermidine synthase
MSLFIESENMIRRSYQLTGPVQTYQSDKAKIEIVPSKLFGSMLYIDGCLQLAQKDEYIYHEMLVHPALAYAKKREKVCIFGGGDGCAVREVLKWPDVKEVTVIDWDARLVYLFQGEYASWNGQSLHNPRVKVEIADILSLGGQKRKYDVLIVDLLDPEEDTKAFWDELLEIVHEWSTPDSIVQFNAGGFLPWKLDVLQWIVKEIRYEWEGNKNLELDLSHVFVPSFTTEWCFCMIKPCTSSVTYTLNTKMLRYFDDTSLVQSNLWTKDYRGLVPCKPINLSDFSAKL